MVDTIDLLYKAGPNDRRATKRSYTVVTNLIGRATSSVELQGKVTAAILRGLRSYLSYYLPEVNQQDEDWVEGLPLFRAVMSRWLYDDWVRASQTDASEPSGLSAVVNTLLYEHGAGFAIRVIKIDSDPTGQPKEVLAYCEVIRVE